MSTPKPKYDLSTIVCYMQEVPDKVKTNERNDGWVYCGTREHRLFLIQDRAFIKLKGDDEKRWYYSGIVLKMADSRMIGVSKIPVYSTTITNLPERDIILLEEVVEPSSGFPAMTIHTPYNDCRS